MTTIILGAQSNVWTQLTLPNPPSGAVPFVWTDNASISAAPLDFNYDYVSGVLKVVNGLKLALVDTTLTPVAAVTINHAAGRIQIAAGQTVVTVTNTLAAVGDIVIGVVETWDATLIRVKAIAGAGTITVTGNAAATAATNISFVLIKTYAGS
jgi:hypothetical protein